jgi:hypothetical protein
MSAPVKNLANISLHQKSPHWTLPGRKPQTKKALTEDSVRAYFLWSQLRDLNSWPADYESAALPTEPHQHNNNSILDFWHKSRGNGAKVEKIFWVGYFCS